MILREFRGAWRRLAKRPGYAALSIGMLGVGLGVVLFLFSLVNTMILQPLPFPHAQRLLAIGETPSNGNGIWDIDSEQYLQLRGHLRSVDTMGAYVDTGFNLGQPDGATYHRGTLLTASMMRLLGVKPILGRGFVAADEVPGAPSVVLLSETLWRHAFHADPHILGRAVQMNGEWATVVGVLPADFGFPQISEIWMPLSLQPGKHRGLSGVSRLAPRASLQQARAELSTWSSAMQRALPAGQHARPLTIKSLSTSFVPEDMRGWIWLMFGATTLVLLLACVNVANLQLVQTLNRRRELALRCALGSNRLRLMAGALAESLLLSIAAVAVALPIVYFANRWLIGEFVANNDPPNQFLRFGIHGWVLPCALVTALISTALAGLIPAWRASRVDLQDALRDGGKGSGGGFARVAKVLVIAEIVLTVVLLVGAGTFVRALGGLLTQRSVGATHAAHVLTALVELPSSSYMHDAKRIDFFETAVERLRKESGVVDATASNTVPGGALGSHEDVSLPGALQPSDGWSQAQMGIVDAHFLDTFGVRLLAGRFFDARDSARSTPAVVIDAKMAQAYWPGKSALNRKIVLYPGKAWAKTVTVIGVIQALQLDGALEQSLPGLLMPLAQAAGSSPLHYMRLAVRTHVDAALYAQQLTTVVHQVDPQAAVTVVYSQARLMELTRLFLRILTQVFSALGLIALLLAAAGLYGVLAFSVTQRTREIGIRRAIGAGHGAIVRDTGRQLGWQLGIGLLIGFGVALPCSRLLADPGLHTQAYDPAVLVPVLLVVVVAAVLAALVPLMRALRVDPAVALRCE